jgi:hypothetical protein
LHAVVISMNDNAKATQSTTANILLFFI